jgi:phage gpG-like protein
MAGFLSYTIANDQKFEAQIKQATALVGDLRVPFQSIVKDFHRSRKAIFKLKGAGKYPPFKGKKLSDGRTAYQRKKIKEYGFDYPLLKASGRLEASVTGVNADSIVIIQKTALAIGTRVPYAVYHQSDEPRFKIPLRKFLFIGPEAPEFVDDTRGNLDRWTKIINDYVTRKLGATFETGGGSSGEV